MVIKLSAKKVDVTPKNNVKKVRFAKPLTSSSNIKQVESSTTSDSNTPVLSPTGLKCFTSNCESKPTGNKRNDMISRTPSRNMKNKVEAQPRKVTKKNRVVEPIRDVDVKHSLLKANSELIYATCCPDSTLLGNVIISRVYYVEGIRHSLFSVGQFCDADLEVAFWKNTCFIRNLEGVDLLSGSRDTNLYTISLDDMLKSSPICLLSKASKTKSWLWHRRLSHLNFGTLNKLAKDGLARGIPRLKFQKDHLCSACALGKSKKSSHQPKDEDTNPEKLYLLHMDLCGPMHVASINGKRYILVIVDDYSRFTWVRFLKTKDEAPTAIIKYKKPDLSFFHVFGALCYPTNDNDDLGKLDAKADIGIFVGYVPAKKAFRIYNKRTQKIIETIHVTFDELTAMASEQFSSGPGLHSMTLATSSSGLISNPVSQQSCIPPKIDDWDRLF
ncbi:integrase, catalytic region, zinc finger, CCHC-type containing protein [Tanacetum coccineum]